MEWFFPTPNPNDQKKVPPPPNLEEGATDTEEEVRNAARRKRALAFNRTGPTGAGGTADTRKMFGA